MAECDGVQIALRTDSIVGRLGGQCLLELPSQQMAIGFKVVPARGWEELLPHTTTTNRASRKGAGHVSNKLQQHVAHIQCVRIGVSSSSAQSRSAYWRIQSIDGPAAQQSAYIDVRWSNMKKACVDTV